MRHNQATVRSFLPQPHGNGNPLDNPRHRPQPCHPTVVNWKTQPLQETYPIDEGFGFQSEVICPSDFGWPISRKRLICIVNNERHILFTIPFAEFLKLFTRTVVTDGDVFFCECSDNQEAELRTRMGRMRGTGDHGVKPTFETHTLTGAQTMRLHQYREQWRKRVQAAGLASSGNMICDLSYTKVGALADFRASTNVPNLYSRGLLWSEFWGRPMFRHELLGTMGWHAIPQSHGHEFGDLPFTSIFTDMHECEAQHLVGIDGIIICIIIFIIIYIYIYNAR